MGDIISFGEAKKRLPREENASSAPQEAVRLVSVKEARNTRLAEKASRMEDFLMKMLGSDEVAFAGVPYPEDIHAKREAIKRADAPSAQLERYVMQSGEAQWESAPAFYLALLEELRERDIISARKK